jgi:hypothetical protein
MLYLYSVLVVWSSGVFPKVAVWGPTVGLVGGIGAEAPYLSAMSLTNIATYLPPKKSVLAPEQSSYFRMSRAITSRHLLRVGDNRLN